MTTDSQETAYHVTSAAGFRGMLDGFCFHLTDTRCTADSGEFLLAYNMLLEFTGAKAPEWPPIGLTYKEPGVEQLERAFMMSFTKHLTHDFQWQMYADHGKGFALEFNAEQLSKLFDRGEHPYDEPVRYLEDLVYERQEQEELIEEFIMECGINEGDAESVSDFRSNYPQHMGRLLDLSSRFKGGYYKAEHESRLVQWIFPEEVEEEGVIHSKERGGLHVNYLNLGLGKRWFSSALTRVVVGHRYPYNLDVISDYLRSRGLGVPVEQA